MHYTIILPGSRFSDFSGNLRSQKLNKVQTKRATITCVYYNSWGSIGSCVDFMFSFLLLYICANSHLLSIYIVASICRYFCGTPLKYCVRYAVQYTVAPAATPRPIHWADCFSFGRYYAGDGDKYIKSPVVVPLSGTPLMFP